MKGAALAAVAITCGSHASPPPAVKSDVALAPVAEGALCVTHGQIDTSSGHLKIREPSVRAVAVGSAGDDALLSFTYVGPTGEIKALASGDVRRQVGLKLRAENGCNLVYVMWRIDPEPGVVVQVKRVPGATDNKQCGTQGYERVKADKSSKVDLITPGTSHTLAASIAGTTLDVHADGKLVWHGSLPDEAADLHGLAGVRADNVEVDADLSVAASDAPAAPPKDCGGTSDD